MPIQCFPNAEAMIIEVGLQPISELVWLLSLLALWWLSIAKSSESKNFRFRSLNTDPVNQPSELSLKWGDPDNWGLIYVKTLVMICMCFRVDKNQAWWMFAQMKNLTMFLVSLGRQTFLPLLIIIYNSLKSDVLGYVFTSIWKSG